MTRRPPKKPGWRDFLPEHPGAKVTAAASVLVAIAYMFGFLKPIVDSGPLPVASRVEVDAAKDDFEKHFDTVSKSLDTTLAVAKTALTNAQAASQQATDFRLSRLIDQRIQLEAALKKNPDDQVLRATLEKTNLDIAKANAQLAPTPSP